MLQFGELGRSLTVFVFGWLTDTWTERWTTVSNLEIPDQPGFNVEEMIQRLKETKMLRVNLSFKTYLSMSQVSIRHTFTITVRIKFVRGGPESLKSSVMDLSNRPDLTVRTAVSELVNLNVVAVIGSQRQESGAALNHQKQLKWLL